MNPLLTRKIKRKLQRELVKRELNQYFDKKGYDNDKMNSPLYPAIMADIQISVPHLFNRCEVVPYSENVDVSTGVYKIGWNLFVLGTNRLSLGYTSHSSVSDMYRATRGEYNQKLPADMFTTPDRVINFILNVLDNSKSGYLELPTGFNIPMAAVAARTLFGNGARTPRIGPAASGAFYSGPR